MHLPYAPLTVPLLVCSCLQPSAAAAQQQQGGGAAGGRPLLAVDMRQLKADEELRRMFGSRVVDEDEDEGGAGGC